MRGKDDNGSANDVALAYMVPCGDAGSAALIFRGAVSEGWVEGGERGDFGGQTEGALRWASVTSKMKYLQIKVKVIRGLFLMRDLGNTSLPEPLGRLKEDTRVGHEMSGDKNNFSFIG